jgi:hypothetical protein
MRAAARRVLVKLALLHFDLMGIFGVNLLHKPFPGISQQACPSMAWAQTSLTCAFSHS